METGELDRAVGCFNKAFIEREFFNNIEGVKATSRIHKLLAMDPTQGPGILKQPDGKYTESSEESAKLLLDTHLQCYKRTAQTQLVLCPDA